MSALSGRSLLTLHTVRSVSLFSFIAAAFGFLPVTFGQQQFEQFNTPRSFETVSDRSLGSVLTNPEKLARPIGESTGDGESASGASESTQTPREAFAGMWAFPAAAGSCDTAGVCQTCNDGPCEGCDGWCLFPNCTPPGMLQWMAARHDYSQACWTGRADALLLWRNAPQAYPLATQTAGSGYATLNANQLDSTPAGGPRFQIFRTDSCGRTWEWAYLRGFNFRSQRVLPSLGSNSYATVDIFGNSSFPFDEAFVNLGSGIQTFEMNYRLRSDRAWRFLAGFRWLEWRESFSMQTNDLTTATTDLYQTGVFNSLYGGQIGIDALLLTLPWLKIDSVLKAGAYYNNAVQRSSYQVSTGGATQTLSVAVDQDPASCGFVGELGFNAAIPLTNRIDFRFGYEALWLASIAQPTDQLADQLLVSGQPPAGSLDTGGSVVVQGVSLGLEGRW